eukprot:365346-Chlamydomonas_euryale.AAC.12
MADLAGAVQVRTPTRSTPASAHDTHVQAADRRPSALLVSVRRPASAAPTASRRDQTRRRGCRRSARHSRTSA